MQFSKTNNHTQINFYNPVRLLISEVLFLAPLAFKGIYQNSR